jgi:beta-xylosidase
LIEAVMLWNEPNNSSHWDFHIDEGWRIFASMARVASSAVRAENSSVVRLLGGISPIDPGFLRNMAEQGVLDEVDAVGVHGFPLDWNLWTHEEWPGRIASVREVTNLPVWVTEAGVSSFVCERIQALGLRNCAETLLGHSERIHWYSLFDLPREWEATTRHREAEGSSYFRHFHMGLLRADGAPKRALREYQQFVPALGICQWFHFEDPRLDDAVRWLRRLGVRNVRTGLSWSDHHCRPDAIRWFDRQMKALESFEVTLTFCFTPEARGVVPHHTSPPHRIEEFAEFCAAMTRRYAA